MGSARSFAPLEKARGFRMTSKTNLKRSLSGFARLAGRRPPLRVRCGVTLVSRLRSRWRLKIGVRRTIEVGLYMSSGVKSYEAERRSTRIRAQIPFRLASLDPAIPFAEQCHTLVVNTEGCGVRLSRPLEPGLSVLLDELPGGTSAPATVANCVPLGTGGKYWLVGLALEQQGNIWCIHPAPADWGIEAKPAVAAVAPPKKENEWPYSVFSSKGEAHPGRK